MRVHISALPPALSSSLPPHDCACAPALCYTPPGEMDASYKFEEEDVNAKGGGGDGGEGGGGEKEEGGKTPKSGRKKSLGNKKGTSSGASSARKGAGGRGAKGTVSKRAKKA